MLATLVAIPLMLLLVVIQSVILSRFELLEGTPDLLLLVVIAWTLQKRVRTAWQWGIIAALINSLYSALPVAVIMLNYLLPVGLTLLLRKRVWQVPILAMFFAVLSGTLISNLVTMVSLTISGNPLSWIDALNLVMLPGLLLNIIFTIPAYALASGLADWLYPETLEV